MNDTLIWTIVGGGSAVPIIAFITFWMTLSSRITSAEDVAKSAKEGSAAAQSAAALANAKHEFIVKDLNRMEVEAAGKIASLTATTEATARSLVAAETRLAKAVEDVASGMDRLSDTIIRTLANLVKEKLQQ